MATSTWSASSAASPAKGACHFRQLAVAWVIRNPAVNAAIVGARRASQLAALTRAASIQLSAADLDTIETILAGAAPVAGPAPEGM